VLVVEAVGRVVELDDGRVVGLDDVVAPGSVVDVVDVVDVVEVVTNVTEGGVSALPGKLFTVGKRTTGTPLMAADMNRLKISAGRLPPLTLATPCTPSIG
jgi:hypothetical protein